MEFLMNYGWAILIVLVAIGTLAYFGVLNPSKYLPSSCTLAPGFGCTDFKINENSVTFVLRNGKGETITISDIKVESCSGTAFGNFADGGETTFIVDGCTNIVNQKFKGDINISYTVSSGISHLIQGGVIGKVENGTSEGQIKFSDDFNRADSTTVGNGWSETDGNPSAEAQILNNRLDFNAIDDINQPIVSRTFTKQTSGEIRWTFTFNFERTGLEQWYEVFMQLGDDALMVNPSTSDNTGVAVNLKWASFNNGMTDHEGFGYVNGGTVTQVAIVSSDAGANAGGDATITVTADLDANTFDLSISGPGLISGSGSATNVPFDNNVDVDVVRIYLDVLNQGKFIDLEIDDVSISHT